ncbi:alpha-ketoglutarate dehydrogenase complex subunit Kgd1 [Aspergillus luchuensis]|uniref:Alpha-ketoglutarate dehydrogenase complex subunit Kgd1 n=1 Tax=Aspergillus kawachii TaxID=1069201 RepID=A0A146F8T0_ASPKA|nr:alpha-ketoglutarate dehydrogenase complex subunit Kgd1 [Aspergillus luchuensis]
MGVGHRGRMNVLYNIVGKDGASMLRDFGSKETSAWGIPGDVKYHYGGSGERVTTSGKKVYMNLAPQPSHVESVNPVVMGKTRAIQDGRNGDLGKTMMLNVHTDAAFAGQGTVYETLGLAALKGYEIGGTLRFIVNNQVGPGQGLFTITNSSLSETAAMGFEVGYSLADPNALVMWEAQFGDFANNAQVIIDNYIASSEKKWLQRSGVVLSLPHGYDGQGPEHTSARLERFLQLGDEDSRHFPTPEQLQRQHQDANIQIVCMTSPANYFHVLRRQIHRDFRKPLIILFSKTLLRHPLARSDIAEFIETPYFQPLLPETRHGITINEAEDVKRVIFCSGQVYAALYKYRETHNLKDTAITRIEELHPFPWEKVRQNLDNYPNATDVVWCQEETLNGGAWGYVMPRFEAILAKTANHTDKKVRYAGRDPMSSVAVGYKVLHSTEEEKVMGDAFQISSCQ